MGLIRGNGRELGTPTARAIRATAARWFALLCVPWVVIAVLVASRVSSSQLQMAALAAAGSAAVITIGLYGLGRLMREVDRLDQERHGLREAYDQARLDSLRDGLTGLGNHRAFQEELARQVAHAIRSELPLSLVIIDLDDLKKLNDTDGHAAGDRLLVNVGRLIRSTLRTADRSFRIGGDEFALLLPATGPEATFGVVRRLLASATGGHPILREMPRFSFSAGISTCPTPSVDGNRLMYHADAALYWAKRHGRTDIQIFDPARHGTRGDERSAEELAAAVAQVASQRALRAVFQPIVSLASGYPVGFEGLVRPAPDSGFADATALFTAAEVADRIVELDMAAIEITLEALLERVA